MGDALRKASRVTGAERDRLAADLRERYDAGQSIRALAAESGRSYGFVRRVLSESGTRLRAQPAGGRAAAQTLLGALMREGVVQRPLLPKNAVPLPERLLVKGGVSDLVAEQRR